MGIALDGPSGGYSQTNMASVDSTSLTVRSIGKNLHHHLYVHELAIDSLPAERRAAINKAIAIASASDTLEFNVIKIHQNGNEMSLLHYPNFFDEAFPVLSRSWRVSLIHNSVILRNYAESRNPPILHRKELLLPYTDSRRISFEAITKAAESIGLFENPSIIGFREQWYQLINDRGYELVGNEFVPIGNPISQEPDHNFTEAGIVQRHLTALSRQGLSAPVQALIRNGLIQSTTTVFDYGCGRGDDVRALHASGVDATGWDPHFAADSPKKQADVVNLGFVINVIEDIHERVAALRGAYEYTKGVLSVAAMLTSERSSGGRAYRDGNLTSRGTFQKYFSQSELRDFVEQALDETAIAAAPGVFFVFRSKDLEQQFLENRYGQRPRALPRSKSAKVYRIREPKRSEDKLMQLFEGHRNILEGLWAQAISFGRIPEPDEVANLNDIEAAVGSYKRAWKLITTKLDMRELETAKMARHADLVVMLAMQLFEKRKPYKHLNSRLQRDIRCFFGSYSLARAESQKALYELASVTVIEEACKIAGENGLGYFESDESLQLHVSQIERLPIRLRIYAHCATILYGDISHFDLIKLHIKSGKISLLKYENFQESPLPRLLERIKINLRSQDMDFFSYGEEFPPPLLYSKSRFMNEEFPRYAEQIAFEESLENLRLFDFTGYGPTEIEFKQTLARCGWEIQGFILTHNDDKNDLDAKCGKHLRYRDLIECGETQASTLLPNLPRQPETFAALEQLCEHVIDPIIDKFGALTLTYGFCSPELATKVPGRIAIKVDQHVSHELNKNSERICDRDGAAVDFAVPGKNMREIADWIIKNLPFDRLYYYGVDRPIHVSYGPNHSRRAFEMFVTKSGRRMPKVYKTARPAT